MERLGGVRLFHTRVTLYPTGKKMLLRRSTVEQRMIYQTKKGGGRKRHPLMSDNVRLKFIFVGWSYQEYRAFN